MSDAPVENTDRELWREPGEFGMEAYAPSVFVTKGGGIGIDVGGTVYVRPLRSWHALAAAEAGKHKIRTIRMDQPPDPM